MKPSNLIAASACALSLCLLAPGSAAAQERVSFLPFLGPHLEASRYSPANEEFAWAGWIGVRADLFEKGKWSGYFDPAVETILGHRVRSFEAVQANYSLEVGARRKLGRGRLSGFFHHVSRHVQDRPKIQAIDWNFLGVRYESAWPERWRRRGEFTSSVGVATLSSGVAYNLEARVTADIDIARREARALYFAADVRAVGADASLAFPRESFVDLRVESGLRRFQRTSEFALFVAYEHRNDALISQSLITDRALFGFRIRGRRPDASSEARP